MSHSLPSGQMNFDQLTKEQLLCQLLQKEYQFYTTILDLTREEHKRFEEQKPLKEITPILQEKKQHLRKITEIENALTPLKKYWKEKAIRTDPSSRAVLSELSKLDSLLREILDLDLVSQKYLESYIQTLEELKAKESS